MGGRAGVWSVACRCRGDRQGGDSRSPDHAGEQVVAQAMRQLGQSVGGEGGQHQRVSPAPQLNVQHRVPHRAPVAPLVLVAWVGRGAGGEGGGAAVRAQSATARARTRRQRRQAGRGLGHNPQHPTPPCSPSTGRQAGGSCASSRKWCAGRVATTLTSANSHSSAASCGTLTVATLPLAHSSTRGRRGGAPPPPAAPPPSAPSAAGGTATGSAMPLGCLPLLAFSRPATCEA